MRVKKSSNELPKRDIISKRPPKLEIRTCAEHNVNIAMFGRIAANIIRRQLNRTSSRLYKYVSSLGEVFTNQSSSVLGDAEENFRHCRKKLKIISCQ